MNELALFAGAGGGILGGKLLGWRTVGAVEIEDYARRVLLQRQRDGFLPWFPIWDDVCTFNGMPWRGCVDVVSGGFPCQDISAAGKGAGIDGARSGLWSEMCRIVCEVRPRWAFMENSPMLAARGLGRVLGDLAESGYDAEWMVLGAADVGAPHRRERMWILAKDREALDADSDSVQCSEQGREYEGAERAAGGCADGVEAGGDVADAYGFGLHEKRNEVGDTCGAFCEAPKRQFGGAGSSPSAISDSDLQRRGWELTCQSTAGENGAVRIQTNAWWESEPRVGRVVDGVAHRVDRLRAIGNGQVPIVAATAFCELRRRFGV